MLNRPTSFNRKIRLDKGSEVFWVLKIASVLIKITSKYVVSCAALYVLSQISILAAVLLPWKLLVVMTTDNYSLMMPEVIGKFVERKIVMLLGTAALLSFVIYATCEVLINLVCRRGSAFILNKNQKMGLFNGHREYASMLYRRFLRAVAAVFTVGVIVVCLFYLYSYMLVALVSYLLIGVAIVVWRRSGISQATITRLTPELKATIWWGAGFFYAVSWLIVGYWHGIQPNLTTAFVSLLLVRQAVVLIFPAYNTYVILIKERNKVDALFLENIPWSPKPETDDGFMDLIEPSTREVWLSSILNKYDGIFDDFKVVSCRVSNAGKVASIIICSINNKSKMFFLVKLFHSSVEESAFHERDILETRIADPLAPHFYGADVIEGHFCHIFGWSSKAGWMSASKRSAQLPEIRKKILFLELPNELISRYDRSRPHLSDRLKFIAWDLLESILPKTSLEQCQQLQRYWPEICHITRLQPRQVVIPRIHHHLIGQLDNKSLICNWTRWRWEPVGSGWPLSTSEAEFQQAFDEAGTQRPSLAQLSAKSAGLMSLLYEFERLWHIKKHYEAIKLVAPIYEAAKNSSIISPSTSRVHVPRSGKC